MNNSQPSGVEPQTRNIRPEKLTEVMLPGQHKANLVREVDPGGAIVVHAVKKGAYVHERLHDLARIDDEMYDAAERFRKDFERAGLEGHYSTVDMHRTSAAGTRDMSDSVVEARQRVQNALTGLGERRNGKSLSKSCLWYVVGCGHTFEQWSLRTRNGGENMSELKASGILISCLERLALHYGMKNTASLKEQASTQAYNRGKSDTIEKVMILKDLCFKNPDPKKALEEFNRLLQEKFGRAKTGG